MSIAPHLPHCCQRTYSEKRPSVKGRETEATGSLARRAREGETSTSLLADRYPGVVKQKIMHLLELDHFGLDVSDLARAERFYTEVLGLEVAQRFGRHQVLLRCGGQMLALFARTDLPPRITDRIENPLGKGHHAFKVSPDDLQNALRVFADRHIPNYGPIGWGDHDCLYFLDPDGNLLEIVAYR